MGTKGSFLPLSVETDYTFPLSINIKAFLSDSSAFVAAALVAAPAADIAWAKAGAKEEPEEREEDMGFGLWLISRK